MYGLPAEFDGPEFIGKTLEEISFGSNIVVFAFGVGLSVSSVSGYSFVVGGDDNLAEERIPVMTSGVVALIGHIVEDVEKIEPGDLAFLFEGRSRLTFRDDSVMYEAYSIQTSLGEIYV